MSWLSRFKSPELPAGVSPGNVWVDLPVIGGLIVIINSVAAPKDIGWFQTNPSPYFLIPVLIGSRYGFGFGAGTGTITAAALLASKMLQGNLSLLDALERNGYFFGALIVIGGLCGEIQNTFKKREIQARVQNDNYQERLKKLDSDTFLLREAKAELERLMATRDSELSTLDNEVRRLFDSEGDDLYQNILFLLNRQVRITDAAIYIQAPNGSLGRRALIGMPEHLPEHITIAEHEVCSLVWKHKASVTIPEFWQGTRSERTPYLTAVPFLNADDDPIGVLVITGMPFIALNPKALHLINLICRWSSSVVELRFQADTTYRTIDGMENQKMFLTPFFRKNLELTHASFDLHGLPSSVVVFHLPGEPKWKQEGFEKLVLRGVRNGDFPVDLSPNAPNVAVLLPLSGDRGAGICRDRILATCRKDPEHGPLTECAIFTFEEGESCEQFWQRLVDYAENGTSNP